MSIRDLSLNSVLFRTFCATVEAVHIDSPSVRPSLPPSIPSILPSIHHFLLSIRPSRLSRMFCLSRPSFFSPSACLSICPSIPFVTSFLAVRPTVRTCQPSVYPFAPSVLSVNCLAALRKAKASESKLWNIKYSRHFSEAFQYVRAVFHVAFDFQPSANVSDTEKRRVIHLVM